MWCCYLQDILNDFRISKRSCDGVTRLPNIASCEVFILGNLISFILRLAIRIRLIVDRRHPSCACRSLSSESRNHLRKLLIFSYAATIDKAKPKLKEIIELVHTSDNNFTVKPISRQETDFDPMLRFMEDKNLFAYWKNRDKKKKTSIFLDYSRKWHDVEEVDKFRNRANIIYLLHHSEDKTVYIGKANNFGSRIKKGEGRIGLDKNWDKFMYFELNPDYNYLLDDIETFAIRFMASVMRNDVKVKSLLNDTKLKLVNKQLKH